jgi:peptidoglycan/LPS O-acetylase OafA/YrhL
VADKSNTRLRLDTIDVLRGVAAFSVALYHIWGHDGGYGFPSIGVVPQTPDPTFFDYLISPFRWGYLGVSLFLVLSGFCIHLPYARKKQEKGDYNFRPREFFVRRIWRLYPAYIVAVVGTAIVLWIAQGFQSLKLGDRMAIPTFADVIGHLTMAHGFIEEQFYSIVSVFWSLSLEFQLYLLYPIFLFLFRKIGTMRAVILLTVVSLIWRYCAITFWDNGLISIATQGPYTLMGNVLARMPEWLFGALVAELLLTKKKELQSSLSVLSIILVITLAILTTLYKELWVATDILFGLGFALLTFFVSYKEYSSTKEVSRSFLFRWFVKIGVISYSLYLFHLQLSWIVETQLGLEPGNVAYMLIRFGWLLLSLLPIVFLYKFIEKPFLKAPSVESKLYRLYARMSGINIASR